MSILNTFRLDGRVAVVTGASSGLGVAFAEAGADVVLAARRSNELAEVAARIAAATGRRARAITADVSVVEDCRRLVDDIVEALGRIDILVNNARVGSAVPALKETPEQFRSVIDVNLHGTYWLSQAAAGQMTDGGEHRKRARDHDRGTSAGSLHRQQGCGDRIDP